MSALGETERSGNKAREVWIGENSQKGSRGYRVEREGDVQPGGQCIHSMEFETFEGKFRIRGSWPYSTQQPG